MYIKYTARTLNIGLSRYHKTLNYHLPRSVSKILQISQFSGNFTVDMSTFYTRCIHAQ
jgi:hypothetical protein